MGLGEETNTIPQKIKIVSGSTCPAGYEKLPSDPTTCVPTAIVGTQGVCPPGDVWVTNLNKCMPQPTQAVTAQGGTAITPQGGTTQPKLEFACEEGRCLAQNDAAVEFVRAVNDVLNKGSSLANIGVALPPSTVFGPATVHLLARVMKAASPFAKDLSAREFEQLLSFADHPEAITPTIVEGMFHRDILKAAQYAVMILAENQSKLPKPVPEPTKSFFSKNKWYIVGGASVLVVGVGAFLVAKKK